VGIVAGRGPTPKDASTRARRNADGVQGIALRFERAVMAASLPKGKRWRKATKEWWDTWRSSPQAEHFTTTDVAFLIETAYVADAFFAGDLKLAGELRLRQGKLGQTPEDRARLRMQCAEPTTAGSESKKTSARERYADLRVISGGPGAVERT
jgi:hypothetical protein